MVTWWILHVVILKLNQLWQQMLYQKLAFLYLDVQCINVLLSNLLFYFIIWFITAFLSLRELRYSLVLQCKWLIFGLSQSWLKAAECTWLVRGSICILTINALSKLSAEIQKCILCMILTIIFICIFSWSCFLSCLFFLRHRYPSFVQNIIANFFVLYNLSFFLTIHSLCLDLL